MITVYGADWCEDTRPARRHLRRLGVPHHYINIDEDLDALQVAKALNNGKRRTPTIDLGVGGRALVEPDNDALTGALVELDMLTFEDANDRLAIQNVGDLERGVRAAAGAALLLGGAIKSGGSARSCSGRRCGRSRPTRSSSPSRKHRLKVHGSGLRLTVLARRT